MGDKVSIDKELMEVGRLAEGDRGGREEGCKWKGQMRGCGPIASGLRTRTGAGGTATLA